MTTQLFLPLNRKSYPQTPLKSTPESRYWSKFTPSHQITPSSTAPITHLQFSSVSPHILAASTGARVILWNPNKTIIPVDSNSLTKSISVRPTKVLSRFKDVAYSPDFKKDGKLLVTGAENAVVQVFDLASRAILRTFRQNKAAVRSARFSADGIRVLTGSDDSKFSCFDLGLEKLLFQLSDHSDYIRTQCPSPASHHIWATGSYDHQVKIYDLRTQKQLMSLNHGDKVDQVLLLPGGSLVATAGGSYVNLWDLFAGGKLLKSLSNHSKAVSCVCTDVSGSYLLSGGLDHQVKILDLKNFEISHSFSYDAQVLSLDASNDGYRLAAGLSNGLIAIRSKKKTADLNNAPVDSLQYDPVANWNSFNKLQKDTRPKPGTLRYFQRGQSAKFRTDDIVIKDSQMHYVKLRNTDFKLKNFEYAEALDCALIDSSIEDVVLVIEELIIRDGLDIALRYRDDRRLIILLKRIISHIQNPKYSMTLMHVTEIILDMYGDTAISASPSLDNLIQVLLFRIKEEIALHQELKKLDSIISTVLGSSLESLERA